MTAGSIAVPTIMPLRAPQPGKSKSIIDTNTKIEIASESPGVTIYFTTNGSKPEPFVTMGPSAKNTMTYSMPIRLPAGRKTIKAVAVAPDGMRESHTVTKAFDVEQADLELSHYHGDGLEFVNDIPGDMAAKKAVNKFAHKMMTSKEAWAAVQMMKDTDDRTKGSSHLKPGRGPRHLNNRTGNVTDRSAQGDYRHQNGSSFLDGGEMKPRRYNPPDSATQAMRLQRETDFLKCVYCFAPRPTDPYARYCSECGNNIPPLPQTRIAPPTPGQMSTCIHCNSKVPFNSPTCLICEAPTAPQNQPQASLKLQEKKVCPVCGTANPINLDSCVTCEFDLSSLSKPVILNSSQQMSLGAPRSTTALNGGPQLTCPKCNRVNQSDARFCDWCGTKPSSLSQTVNCGRCHATNQPYAKFCGGCGTLIEPPMPGIRTTAMPVTVNPELGGRNSQNKWLQVATPGRPVPSASVATQTVGLFYPSQKDMNRKITDTEERLAEEKLARDRRPLLTAVSPGRGYWRKQMDHITAHLKAHAQNDAEFRALIGEPRMGKIISTSIHEDGFELSLTVNFALRGVKDPLISERMGYTSREYLSTYTEGRKSSFSRYGSQESLGSGRSTDRKPKRKPKAAKKKKPVVEEKLSYEEKQLLKEVSKNGDGNPTEIQTLIQEGADPNVVNSSGIPVLHLAVKHKHADAIPMLVQEGADVNMKGPNRGNTALHEAVLLGHSGLEVIDALLGCNANPQKKNDKDETAYDLAVKAGFESVGNRLAANLGQSALDRLTRPKSSKTELH